MTSNDGGQMIHGSRSKRLLRDGRARVVCLALLVLTSCLTQMQPAASATTSPSSALPRITPVSGGALPADFRGPFVIDFSGAPTGRYQIWSHTEVPNPACGIYEFYDYDGTNPIETIYTDTPFGLDLEATCTLEVAGFNEERGDFGTSATWKTAGVRPTVSAPSILDRTIWPYSAKEPVYYSPEGHGGYGMVELPLESTISWHVYPQAWSKGAVSVHVIMKNAAGVAVRTARAPYVEQYSWNGMGDNGRPVAPGIYTAFVEAKDPYGRTSTLRAGTVKVAHEYVAQRWFDRIAAGKADRVASAGQCNVTRYGPGKRLLLACSGEGQFRLTYHSQLPKNTRDPAAEFYLQRPGSSLETRLRSFPGVHLTMKVGANRRATVTLSGHVGGSYVLNSVLVSVTGHAWI